MIPTKFKMGEAQTSTTAFVSERRATSGQKRAREKERVRRKGQHAHMLNGCANDRGEPSGLLGIPCDLCQSLTKFFVCLCVNYMTNWR